MQRVYFQSIPKQYFQKYGKIWDLKRALKERMEVFDREKSRRIRKAELYQYLVKWCYPEAKPMKIKKQNFRTFNNWVA